MAKTASICLDIIKENDFCELSADAQALYFHVVLNASKDGTAYRYSTMAKLYGINLSACDELIKAGYIVEGDECVVIPRYEEHARRRLNHSERESKEYKDWRESVLRRDNYKCRLCGSTDAVEAHHIEPFSKNKLLRTDVDNGITLCRSCHISKHAPTGQI